MPFRGMPADVIATPGMMLVREFQRAPGEAPSRAGHIAGLSQPDTVLEALWRVQESPLDDYKPPFTIWRHIGLTAAQRLAVAREAQSYLGRWYGAWKLPLHLADNLTSRGIHLLGYHQDVVLFRRLQFLRYWPNCHTVWAKAYEDAIGYQFGMRAWHQNPDCMRDFMEASPDWRVVFER